uniref:Family with sequence similarity 227 member B n=1 Tax=Monodelphis domestica TaxID=13616 RepID=A0A5F8GNN2_MONDO
MDKLKEECSFDAIHKHLCEHVPTQHKALLEMEFRLKDLYGDFVEHVTRFLNFPPTPAYSEKEKKLVEIKKMIEKFKKKRILMYPYRTTEKKSIENYTFPGFKANKSTKLPRHLEATEIFLYVLKTQKLERKSFKIWLPLLLSESSIELLKDAFWWWFLHKFKPNQCDQDHLFDRISENYVSFIVRVPNYEKDTFFKLYPDCLSQAIYTIFQEAFPDSSHLFDDEFKEELVTTIFQWVTGVIPPRRVWTRWNLGRLEENTIHGTIKRFIEIEDQKLKCRNLLDKKMEFDLEKLIMDYRNVLLPSPEEPVAKKESHLVGLGPQFCRILFTLGGQSPLVAYYMKVHEIGRNPKLPYSNIQMTQIYQWPATEGQTYNEVITESRKIFAKNKAAHKIESKYIKDEIREIQQKHREHNRMFESFKDKAKQRPEEAMHDCRKYLEKLSYRYLSFTDALITQLTLLKRVETRVLERQLRNMELSEFLRER